MILAVALVVLGPRKLPEMARHLGRFYGQIRRTTFELRSTLDRELREEERTLRREKAVQRRQDLETLRREREDVARDRLEDAPDEPLVSEAPTDAGSSDAAEPQRARDDDGRFKGDDPSTPDVDEAWTDGEPT